MHRSSFCVTGMFRDMFLFKNYYMMRMLILLIVVSMAIFEVGTIFGLLSANPFPLLGPPSLATILGGVLFGFAMVLAGGCVVGTLYKMGSGSVLSVIAFIGLLAGSAFYAEIHHLWSALAKSTSFTSGQITLPQLFNTPSYLLTFPIAIVAGLYLFKVKDKLTRPSSVDGYIQPWKVAIILALLGSVSYLFVGMPLGITTSYAKLGASVEMIFAREHVFSLPYFTGLPLSYIPPFTDTLITGGAGPKLDAVAAIQYPLVLFITLGATLSAVILKEFKIHYRLPLKQYVTVLVGGFFLGLAARMVPGCNIWHLWGGVPILSMQSLIYAIALLPGTWLGSKFLAKYIITH
ncbi:MAG: YeeE/YedE family protein [Gammaproteobacteria bacterium]|nr:YeeE/YedE family protein [Gammaproteobacteria bacterium]